MLVVIIRRLGINRVRSCCQSTTNKNKIKFFAAPVHARQFSLSRDKVRRLGPVPHQTARFLHRVNLVLTRGLLCLLPLLRDGVHLYCTVNCRHRGSVCPEFIRSRNCVSMAFSRSRVRQHNRAIVVLSKVP